MKGIIKHIFVLQTRGLDKILQSARLKQLHVANGVLIQKKEAEKSVPR